MTTWVPEPNVQDCDETAPEAMAGKMYSRRFTTSEPVDGLYGVVTVQFYCDDQWMASGEQVTAEELTVSRPVRADERYRIGQVVEFVRAADPTQLSEPDWSTYRYRYSWFARGEKFTDEQIKAVAEKFELDWIHWDGSESPDDQDVLDALIEPLSVEDWSHMILSEELKDWFFLYELFRDEECPNCYQGADGHTVGPGPMGHRHAWCKLADPAYALDVARQNVETGDTTKAANGYSEDDLRKDRLCAALDTLDEQKLIDGTRAIRLCEVITESADEHARTEARVELGRLFGAVQQKIHKAA